MWRPGARPSVAPLLGGLWLVALLLLTGLPSESAPHVAVAPAPAIPGGVGSTSTNPTSTTPVQSPAGPTAPHSAPGPSARTGSGPSGFSGVAGRPTPTNAMLTKPKGTPYDWSSAYVGYDPTDPANLMFGEGTGMVDYNAMDEVVFFGGLATGGLSGITWIYNWWYNASNIYASSEGWNATRSLQSPSARTNMSFQADQALGQAVLYGGLTGVSAQSTANDTWIYNFQEDQWSNVTKGTAPPNREEAAFAVDETDGIGLLFGGIAPHYTSRSSTGEVIWQDTWVFHFATDTWTPVTVPTGTGPSARFGASMVWDPVSDVFFLVAGCGFSCNSDAWAFSPSTLSWSAVAETGDVPAARLGASFAWDPTAHQAVMFGGASFDPNGSPLVYDDSFIFLPTGQWIRFTPAQPGPAPIYQPYGEFDVATTWSNFPDCNVMWIVGGNPSLQAIPNMVYVIQPSNDTPSWQCWWWWAEPGPYNAPPPTCSHASQLVVTVESTRQNVPIPNAIVSVSGHCEPNIGITGPTGSFQFTLATPDNLSINVSANFFHGTSLWYNYTYGNSTANTSVELVRYITVHLVPFPTVNVQVLGDNGGVFLSPVVGASVVLDNSSVLAITDTSGWGNSSAVSEFNQSAYVTASADNYSTVGKGLFIPYSGTVNLTVTLLRAGTLTVKVVDGRTSRGIPDATGRVTRLDPGLPAPFAFTTSSDGTFARRLPLGNYSAVAGAAGYLTNSLGGRAYLPWVTNATILIRLTLDYGTNSSVRLLNAWTHQPIAGGLVTFGTIGPYPTNPAGWANGTDLGPAGVEAKITGSAAGYSSNSTLVTFGYDLTLKPIIFNLTPSCTGVCPVVGGSGGAGLSGLLPGGVALALLTSAPALMAVAGAFYALGLASRRPRRSLSIGQRAVGPGGPVEREGSP